MIIHSGIIVMTRPLQNRNNNSLFGDVNVLNQSINLFEYYHYINRLFMTQEFTIVMCGLCYITFVSHMIIPYVIIFAYSTAVYACVCESV